MDPDPDFPDRIRIFGRSRSGTGLRKEVQSGSRKKPGSERPKHRFHVSTFSPLFLSYLKKVMWRSTLQNDPINIIYASHEAGVTNELFFLATVSLSQQMRRGQARPWDWIPVQGELTFR